MTLAQVTHDAHPRRPGVGGPEVEVSIMTAHRRARGDVV
jgi:hypothetical protein